MEAATIFDGIHNATLSNQLDNLLPTSKNRVTKSSNLVLATLILVNMVEPVLLLLAHLKSQEQQLENTTSHLCARERVVPSSRTSSLLEEMVNVIETIDKTVRQKRSNQHADIKLNSHSLTAAQRELTYSKSNRPQDPVYQTCAFCDHPSVNELLNNGEIEDINMVVESEYQAKMKV